MYEYEKRRGTSPRRGSKKGGAKSGRAGAAGVQLVLCALLLAGAVGLRFSGTPLYTAARAQAKTVLSSNVTMADVNRALRTFANSMPNVSQPASSQRSASSQKAVASQKSSAPASSGSSAASLASASSKAASGVSKTTSQSTSLVSSKAKAASSAVPAAQLDGQGGEDIEAQPGGAPPENALLSPLQLSVRPVLPVHGRLTSGFGWRVNPITGKVSFHTGIDIAVPEGTPVSAALPGVVKETGSNAAYGYYVLMDNGGGVQTFYGHLSAIVAPQGSALRAGGVLAKSGNTGMSTGPHLHFEIRVHGKYMNALWVLTPDES